MIAERGACAGAMTRLVHFAPNRAQIAPNHPAEIVS